jgi:predicted DNA-binding protein
MGGRSMTTVRLPLDIEQKLEILSRTKHKSKTELIKEALEKLFYQAESEKDSYEIGEDYFGKYGSGNGSLSVNYKQILKGKINAKYNSH